MIEDTIGIVYIVSVVYLLIVGITGTFLNSTALIKAMKAPKTRQNLVITNLIVSELLISFIGVPLDLIGTMSKGKANNSILCPTTGFAHTLCGMSSIYTLVAMALIRYSSVVKFERTWHIATHDDFLTSRYVQFIWLLALLMALPPTFGMGQYIQDVGMISCGPNWASSDAFDLFYNWYLMICGFFIPTAIMVFCNIFVVRTSNKQAEIRQNYYQLSIKSKYTPKRSINKERKVAILIVSMTLSFYIVWTPYAITSIWAMILTSAPRFLTIISILFAKSGTIINPILYIFFNKDIVKSHPSLSTSHNVQCLSDHPAKLGKKFRSEERMTEGAYVDQPTTELRRNKKLRPKSYYIALRESMYIDFETAGSYSYWNHQYSNFEKRHTYVEENNLVVLESEKMESRSVNSV